METLSKEGTSVNQTHRSVGATRLPHASARPAASSESGEGSLLESALTQRTSLSLPPSIQIDEWSKIGRQICVIADSSAWWLGDWLVYGQSQYPDRYKRAIAETSLDYQTLRNYAWVARQYAPERRRVGLSFQHHAELAGLNEGEQEQWLDRAERFGWSRNELRKRVRASRTDGKGRVEPDRVLKIQMSIPPTQRQRWLDAASTSDQDLLSWMVSVLNDAAAAALGQRSEHVANPEPEAQPVPT